MCRIKNVTIYIYIYNILLLKQKQSHDTIFFVHSYCERIVNIVLVYKQYLIYTYYCSADTHVEV